MEKGYVAIGVLCFLYYICLVWHTRKINSTFAWFWIVLGLFNVALGAVALKTSDWAKLLMLIISSIIWIVFIVVELIVLCAMLAVPKEDLDYIIILGAQIRGKRITNVLERRLNKGLQYLQENPKTICIVSGGKGIGEEVSEAEAMADYLISKGIDESRILREGQSKNTWQNLINSKKFVDNISQNQTGIVTNNFHIYRSMKMAKLLGYENVFAFPASTNMVVFPNYMTREFLAIIKMFLEIKKYNVE